MKPGFKFFSFSSVVILLSWSTYVVQECTCSAIGNFYTSEQFILGVFSTIFAGGRYVGALPPSLFRKRLGSPMPQIGRPISLDDEDSDEDEEDLLDDESQPRVEPRITPLNRDQCLAKLLCGMSVPVTGGNSKKNYYSEYATIVSKFFEAFPLDDELQSKESIETYDDYSNEDDGKPTRLNSKRKPMNSSRVEATAPTLQLFDLALVDVAKPEDIAKNRTRKAAFEKVSTGNRIARARKIVENLGQKLQTVRQCQSITGCPFTFKQLREKLKKKDSQRISSNIQLPPGPIWPLHSKRKHEPTPAPFKSKPDVKTQSRPRPLPPTSKPDSQSVELFSPEEPTFPFKDTTKGDDEMEEIFGPAPVSKKPMGFHQGVDEHFNYEYNPDKPWRPGATGSNSYGVPPWKVRPRPQSKPFSRPNAHMDGHHRLPPRPRPRPEGNNLANQKRYPPQNQNQQQNRRPQPRPQHTTQPRPKKPAPPPTTPSTTTRSPFPKKKISYLNSPYTKPNLSGEDDEGSEDINKVAPVELIGNLDAGEHEPFNKATTTIKPKSTTETSSKKKKKKDDDDDDDSEEYDDDDNYDDDYDDDQDALDEEDDDDDYSDEEEEDKESESKKKKVKKEKKKNKKKKKNEDEEEEDADEKTSTTTVASVPKIKKFNQNSYVDDETEDIHEIWTKLTFATTGGNYKPPEKYKKNDTAVPEDAENAADDDDEDEDEDEDDEEPSKSSSGQQRTRTSSTSASTEDDDEVDEENSSKAKRHKPKSKSKVKSGYESDDLAADTATSKKQEKSKNSKKTKKNKKKPGKKGSSEEDDYSENTKRKQVMLEIGGRPLVPKPESDKNNAKKTSSLISNRFKFQLINPYKPAPPPPSDANLPGAYTPLKASYIPTSAPSNAGSSAMSSLPFNFNLNPGPLSNLGGGGGVPPPGGFPGMSSSSGSMSLEMPDPHHPPPPGGYMPPPQTQPHQQRQEHFAPHPTSLSSSSIGGSGLFKLNPLPALSNLFKRPSGFDPIKGPEGHGHGPPPPPSAFMHRPVGPESSHYKREKQSSPASGSSNPTASSATKKSTKSKASKGKKGKF